MSDDRGQYITTFSGRRFYPADPRVEEVHLVDIAHALANSCRFTGHVREFWSVAQHSVLCASMAPKEYALEALLHDASEAYLADIARPVKMMLPDYQAIEKKVERACAERFGTSYPMSPVIKEIDNRMLVTEAAALLSDDGEHWWEDAHWPAPFPIKISPWSPKVAKQRFLLAFARLTRGAPIDDAINADKIAAEHPAETCAQTSDSAPCGWIGQSVTLASGCGPSVLNNLSYQYFVDDPANVMGCWLEVDSVDRGRVTDFSYVPGPDGECRGPRAPKGAKPASRQPVNGGSGLGWTVDIDWQPMTREEAESAGMLSYIRCGSHGGDGCYPGPGGGGIPPFAGHRCSGGGGPAPGAAVAP